MTDVLEKPAASSPAKVPFGRMKPAGHSWNTWEFSIPAGTPMAMLAEPTYWAHYWRQIQPNDLIIALCEDGAWECEMRVLSTAQGEVRAKTRFAVEYDSAGAVLAEKGDYVVKWISPPSKYGVFRKDGTLVRDKFYPRAEAVAFMTTLAKAR